VEVAVVAPHDLRHQAVPVYPPLDGGLAILEGGELLATQGDLIELLRRHVSLPPAEFERKYLGPIRRLSDFIGLLPASRAKHHCGAGGLFRFALEMGVHAARTADGVIFAGNEQFERRRDAETAWRHAAFLTALCSELYRPLLEMQVVDAKGDVWGPYLAGLNEWARERRTKQVYVRWVTRDSEIPGVRAVAGYALNSIAGQALLNDLHGVSPSIVHAMVGTVTGTMTALDDHPLQRVIQSVRSKIIEVDQARAPTLYGNLTQGSHLEPFLLDGMRQLLAKGKWTINGKNARMHYGRDGLHLVWPIGAQELLTFLRDAGVEAIPANPVTLGEMFLSSGIVEPANDGQPWHMVFPSTAEEKAKDRILTVRFKRPRSIIPPELEDVQPVDWKLASGPPSQSAGQAAGAGPAGQQGAPIQDSCASPPDAVSTPAPGVSTAESAAQAPAGGSAAVGIVQGKDAADGGATATEGRKRSRKASPKASSDGAAAGVESGESGDAGGDPSSAAPSHEQAPPSVAIASHPEALQAGDQAAVSKGLPPGAIPERPARDTDISGIPPDLIALIGKPLAGEMASWRAAWNSGRSSRHFMVVEGGLAVTVEYITNNSVLEPNKVIEPLRSNGLLVMREDAGRTRPVHRLQFPDAGEQVAFIFKRSFVARCGFTLS
jgi:conjugal transfer pilus assembly protein TraI